MKALCLPSGMVNIYRQDEFQTLPFTMLIDRIISLPAGVNVTEGIHDVEVRVDNIAMLWALFRTAFDGILQANGQISLHW
jgi:hypothetical protein